MSLINAITAWFIDSFNGLDRSSLWVKSADQDANGNIPVILHGEDGQPIDAHTGSLNVHVKDVHYDIINRFFSFHTGTTTNIAIAISEGDTSFTVGDAAAFSVGDPIELEDSGTSEATTTFITAIATNLITVDRPLENGYTTAGTVQLLSTMIHNANGTLANPVLYKVEPPAGDSWHIDRVILSATDNGTLSDNKFISATALTNGLVFRVTTNGVTRIMTNWKSNQDMITDAFDVDYNAKAGGGTDNGLRCRWTFKSADVVVLLNGSNGDKLEILVQDNISALGISDIRIKGQGHEI